MNANRDANRDPNRDPNSGHAKPLVLITGAAGNIGQSLIKALQGDFRIAGLDRDAGDGAADIAEMDITDASSVTQALDRIGQQHGRQIAAVIHLIAFFDFSGEPDPLYEKVNVDGTRNLLKALESFEVGRFIYASTMLVHQPQDPGQTINEETPLDPRWEYPQSKLAAEDVIRAEAAMPFAILRLAGIYDEGSAVPTLAHQIARIYEESLKSHLYAGPLDTGQSMLHRDDMTHAVRLTIDRRSRLPAAAEILIGEPQALGYDDLQDMIGALVHGTDEWKTLRVPAPIAKAGVHLENAIEPLVPDAIDQGEKPFIQPFMIGMAADHYALDITRARQWLGWDPAHRLGDELPAMIANLTADPQGWYQRNGITPPEIPLHHQAKSP